VAVASDRDPQPVRQFRTFTADLKRRAEWLVKCGITTVAMESTGVYWIPIYEILEERGLWRRYWSTPAICATCADARATFQIVSGCATYIA